jgi:hypothetical protein
LIGEEALLSPFQSLAWKAMKRNLLREIKKRTRLNLPLSWIEPRKPKGRPSKL